ncbi:MAG: DUF5684 domain-containing protein [Acidobacteriota bacterium]|nr:MAG: DUF5684 domain-containing protein [Acidobacteriota bacterium]
MILILALQDLGSDGGSIAGAIGALIYLAFMVLMVASVWKIYDKAGEPGWASIIPIYNVVVLLKIVGRPIWWLLLMFIPLVQIIIAILVMIDLAKSFGQGAGYGIGLVFLPFIFGPMLAFGDASYRGPAAA